MNLSKGGLEDHSKVFIGGFGHDWLWRVGRGAGSDCLKDVFGQSVEKCFRLKTAYRFSFYDFLSL